MYTTRVGSVAELAYAYGLGPYPERVGGSTPLRPTQQYMATILTKHDDNTIDLKISIPWSKVKTVRDEVVATAVKNANLPGFRKGKAPKKMVEENLDSAKVQEEVLKKILPPAYIEAVKEHNLNPILNPKIHIEKLEEEKDWEFTASTCEAPQIHLNNYKDAIQKITAKSKIVIPGKEPETPKFEDIMQALLTSATIAIPKILVDQEVDRLLAQTLDEIKRLGLSLDQYLASTGKSAENLRADYEQKAKNDITLEFALQKVAEQEKITVEEKEIEEAIQKAKDDAERKHLQSNRYLLANILRQQKTLDFLKNL